MSDSTPFTYSTAVTTAPTITAISPDSSSPVVKTTLEITGTGFGTDSNALSVYLKNATGLVYELKVLEATDNLVKVGLSGGLPGSFDVELKKTGSGFATSTPATANNFNYEILINDVQPVSGSPHGGTLVTITG